MFGKQMKKSGEARTKGASPDMSFRLVTKGIRLGGSLLQEERSCGESS